MKTSIRLLGGALAAALIAAPVLADTVKITLIHGTSGSSLDVYSKQDEIGFKMGLEYATNNTMEVNGHKIELIHKDTQFKPDVARAVLAEAYGDDDALIAVGGTSSGVTKAMLPIAKQYKRILIVEPAVADSLTGKDSNRYVFKTSRNSSQDMQAQALSLNPDKDLYVATLAQDYAFGRDGIEAFKSALKDSGATVVDEEYVPLKTTDYTAAAERMFAALKDKPGRKVILIYVAGGSDPLSKIAGMDPGRYGIELSAGGNILPAMVSYKAVPGMLGATYYYYGIPKNPINDWLVTEHEKRYSTPPDFFTAGGMTAALAVVKALKESPSLKTDDLIKTMAGMSWDTPKGEMIFRASDHQAMQDMYAFKIKVDPNVDWAVPELVRVIKPSEMDIPVGRENKN
ncbi:substrate-binding domain-containing protein [Thioclava sp.]|uniref:substrate-binding domain-containing protein n=1 Tax=Thioclava sp. TaxID=1933450 RepID=UPI003AA8D23F